MPKKRETGWLIEHGSNLNPPMYWQDWGRWSSDHETAIRFARRRDAFKISLTISSDRSDDLPPHRVVEHSWG